MAQASSSQDVPYIAYTHGSEDDKLLECRDCLLSILVSSASHNSS